MQAGSLIVSVFGDAVLPRGGRIWLGSLIEMLQPFNINERLVRTSIFRLAKDEWLTTESAGRRADYLLTPAGHRLFEQAAHVIYAANNPGWDRRWRLLLLVGDLQAKARETLRQALFWQGFGMVSPSCFVHPSVELSAALDALATEGLHDQVQCLLPMLAVGTGFSTSASESELVQSAWNLNELGAAYHQFLEHYTPLLKALRKWHPDESAEETAFLLRTLLIHHYRKLLLRDPGLPDVLLPGHWPGQKARALCKDLYLRLLEPSERYLDRTMKTADGETPAARSSLYERFQPTDPLSQ